GGARPDLDDQDLVVCAVRFAAHVIATHDGQAPARRSRAQLAPRRIPHDEMPPEGRDHFGVEHVAVGHSCSIASILMPSSDYLVWIDLEMTGLKPDTDVIIEMATIVTDADLNVVAEGPVIAIHQPDSALDGMDDWNKRT